MIIMFGIYFLCFIECVICMDPGYDSCRLRTAVPAIMLRACLSAKPANKMGLPRGNESCRLLLVSMYILCTVLI